MKAQIITLAYFALLSLVSTSAQSPRDCHLILETAVGRTFEESSFRDLEDDLNEIVRISKDEFFKRVSDNSSNLKVDAELAKKVVYLENSDEQFSEMMKNLRERYSRNYSRRINESERDRVFRSIIPPSNRAIQEYNACIKLMSNQRGFGYEIIGDTDGEFFIKLAYSPENLGSKTFADIDSVTVSSSIDLLYPREFTVGQRIWAFTGLTQKFFRRSPEEPATIVINFSGHDPVSIELPESASKSVPPGTIVAFFGNAAPIGWLDCNGGFIPNEPKYRKLRSLVGPKTPRAFLIKRVCCSQ